jgi:hypothetical protein
MKRSRIITFKINGQDIAAREDETILELSRQNGIPHSHPVLPGRGIRLRRLPPVHGGDQRL